MVNTSITKGVQRKIILSWIFAQIARLNPNKAGLFEGSFFRGGQFLTAPSPFHPISSRTNPISVHLYTIFKQTI